MEVLELGLEDAALRARYDELFENCPDAFVQQSTYWAEVIRDLGPDRPIFLLCQAGEQPIAGLPLYLYENPHGNILTSVPQAGPLGGVFFHPELTPAEIEQAYAALLAMACSLAVRHNCISLTIITSPFFADLEYYERFLAPTFVFENFTQYIVLPEIATEETITLRDYNRRSNLSRNIRKGREAGLAWDWSENVEELRAWHRVHAARHSELGVVPLKLEFFEKIWDVLKPRDKARLLLVRKDGEIASGCLYIYHRKILDVFMLSMDARFADLAPNFLNTEMSLLWARRYGVEKYNWQSSSSRTSGVYGYKKQWGSRAAPYYFVTRLFCPPERICNMGREALQHAYPWHYVAPFGIFEQGCGMKYFKKA